MEFQSNDISDVTSVENEQGNAISEKALNKVLKTIDKVGDKYSFYERNLIDEYESEIKQILTYSLSGSEKIALGAVIEFSEGDLKDVTKNTIWS